MYTNSAAIIQEHVAFLILMMMMMKLLIYRALKKLELVLSTAQTTGDNTDKDSKNRKRSH